MTTPTHAEERAAGLGSAAGGNPRFPCVEGLRAVAAVSVLVHHVAGFTGAVTSTAAGYVLAHLDVGVSVFFVLSGFLLYRPFVAADADRRPGPSLRRYAGRRFLRIFPAYWVALTIVLFGLETVRHGGSEGLLRTFSLTHIYSRDHVLGGIVPAWSLATELSFYLFLPVWAVAVGALARRSARPLAVATAGAAGLWATGLSVHAYLLFTREASTPATLWLPAQIDLFALGMLLAVAHVASARGTDLPILGAAGRHPGLTWTLAVVPFWVAATQLDLPREFADMPDGGALGRQVCYGLVAVLVVLPAVFGDQSRGWPRRFLRLPPVAWVGLVSYGLFLWHFDLLRWLEREGAFEWVPGARFLSVLAMTLAAGLTVAWLSWRLVEAPLVRWRKTTR